jgi:hypothetical protein
VSLPKDLVFEGFLRSFPSRAAPDDPLLHGFLQLVSGFLVLTTFTPAAFCLGVTVGPGWTNCFAAKAGVATGLRALMPIINAVKKIAVRFITIFLIKAE